MKSKIKWAALGGLVLSFVSLLVHLFLAKSSANIVHYAGIPFMTKSWSQFIPAEDVKVPVNKKLWGKVKALEGLHPYAKPRSAYPVPITQNNGFIYAKIFGGFEKIRNSICDLVAVARLLNATLVIPEIQQSIRSKGISSNFKSFSYIYNEEQFIAALATDVIIVKDLPPNHKDARKQKQFPTFRPQHSAPPSFYLTNVLPKLKKAKVVGLIVTDGGCLQSILPNSLGEYQRLRCRVAFHALQFRSEIVALGRLMVQRLRYPGHPYLSYHPGLIRDTLAYHGCAELFQDIHSELIQYRRKQLIKQGIVNQELSVDSYAQKANGSCPLMPEEVGLLLRAMGYPPTTTIYLAGSETFGGQRVLIPLHAMYTYLVDRTSLCSKQELDDLIGPETPLPPDPLEALPAKSVRQQKEEWEKAGPRPRPLPPPPDRPIYRHEKEGWYGWVAENDTEPNPSPSDLREQAHRLLWDALDYIVSVEADAFFPGFDNDGSQWPDFSGLVMGHRLYEMASSRTFRPNRTYLAELFNSTSAHLYYPPHNWTLAVKAHLNKSLAEEGLNQELHLAMPKTFLSHPIPECSCTTLRTPEVPQSGKDSSVHLLYEGQDECPKWMEQSLAKSVVLEGNGEEFESQEDEVDSEGQPESEGNDQSNAIPSWEQGEDMDPDD
ncbi:unnamed protein product [Coffea canephora]|uniref:O-fucosyltransferase family protein n=1 Tax=Coffea canephora TaxID=49390 RepID=A0A068UWC0_COFCA|nr:unnamed protein product [Coffea canephora]